ncbi:hypothetical protein ACFL6C_02495 [Myxococcota bacterium]
MRRTPLRYFFFTIAFGNVSISSNPTAASPANVETDSGDRRSSSRLQRRNPRTTNRARRSAEQQYAPARAARTPDLTQSTNVLFEQMKQLFDALDYETAIAVAREVISRKDVTTDMRLHCYLLQGSALAIVGDPIEAEKPFRFLLRGRPAFDMPSDTPPKILAVFRKVQVEERAIVEQLRELERKRIMQELRLTPISQGDVIGGLPLPFQFKLRDPRQSVDSVQVHYRRVATEPFSVLATQVDEQGLWQAELPAEWTENASGFELQYFVTTADANESELISLGGPAAPLTIEIQPGMVESARPLYESPWFWAIATGVAAAAAVGGWLIYDQIDQQTGLPSSDIQIHLSE